MAGSLGRSLGLPPNQFSEVTDDNHAGTIWIVAILCLIYSVLTFITRGFIKWKMIGIDDYVLIAAQVVAFAQYGSLFSSLHNGLGRTVEQLPNNMREKVSEGAMGTEILLLLSLCLSKASVVFLIRRVFTRDMKRFWRICNILLGCIAVWGLASILVVTVGCSTTHYLPPTQGATCSGYLTRWEIVIALDVATELIFVFLPIYLVWDLQMAFDLKARVFIAFLFRLPVAAFALTFLLKFNNSLTSTNPGVAIASALTWQQAELSYSLISATIPCLKSFIQSFDTSFGHGQDTSIVHYGNGSSGGQASHRATIKMTSLKTGRSMNASQSRGSFDGPLRPDKMKNSTTIYANGEVRSADRSSVSSKAGSQEMIIRRDVQFDVTHDYVHTGV
ncbi:hypothetical protein K432DRAFT_383549 [Lepidopterella palustris CBS 459.81]|uniref:Rhodopsin domain-containing protein n=1 Tax=Lepidopterella palustris CBS 459.81 TaxID=1314670 RepID=A0A8E2E805_9PEZI|nr:hypothetical protein K432DRAFT_383549 [Lepidopterella palustris CBS 459.81]